VKSISEQGRKSILLPNTESSAKLIPYIHDLAARKKSGATITTMDSDKVTKAITMDQTM
jgi:hypothetical protein